MSKTTNKIFPEVRARAVRMVLDHLRLEFSGSRAVSGDPVASGLIKRGTPVRAEGRPRLWIRGSRAAALKRLDEDF